MESACAVRPHPATRAFSLPSPHHPPSLPGPGSSLGSACEHGRVREERVVAADGGSVGTRPAWASAEPCTELHGQEMREVVWGVWE